MCDIGSADKLKLDPTHAGKPKFQFAVKIKSTCGFYGERLNLIIRKRSEVFLLSGDALNAEVQKLSYVYLGGAEDSVGNSIYLSATRNDSGYTEEEYLDELKAQLEAAQARCAELEEQLANAPAVTACGNEQELEAYRRAERAERVANERAELIYHRANSVLTEACTHVDALTGRIGSMSDEVLVKLQQLQEELTELEAQLEYKEERWMYLTELKEKIDAQTK